MRYKLVANAETTLSVDIMFRNELFGNIVTTASIEHDGSSSKDATVIVDGVETKISVRSAPGNEAKVTVFYDKQPTASPEATSAAL